MRLASITIRGYKSIQEAHIPLGAINVLVGANGSGKSNLLSFFDWLPILEQEDQAVLNNYIEQQVGKLDQLFYKGTACTRAIQATLSFQAPLATFETTLRHSKEGEVELVGIPPHNSEPVALPEANTPTAQMRTFLSTTKRYHFHDTGRNSPFIYSSHSQRDAYFFYSDGSNLAAFLYHLQQEHPIVYTRLVRVIQSVVPFFADFILQPLKNGFVRLQWKDRSSNLVYGADDLSDGSLRFMALVVLLMQPHPPSCIVVDEPELGLHPVAISKLAGLFKGVVSKGSQVLLATQSADLLSCFEQKDVLAVEQVEGASQFRRLEATEVGNWLEDYRLGDWWKL